MAAIQTLFHNSVKGKVIHPHEKTLGEGGFALHEKRGALMVDLPFILLGHGSEPLGQLGRHPWGHPISKGAIVDQGSGFLSLSVLSGEGLTMSC